MSGALLLGVSAAAIHSGRSDQALAIAPLPTPSLPSLPVPTPSLPNLPVPTQSLPNLPGLPSALPSLPIPQPSLPVPSPSLPGLPGLPSPLPSLPIPQPSLPVPSTSPSLPVPSPTLPVPKGSPVPGAVPTPGGGSSGGGGQPTARPTAPQPIGGRNVAYNSTPANDPKGSWTLVLPSVTVPAGAVGIALLVAIAALPLLAALGLIALGRFWGSALSMRSSRLRMALASELELSPRELAALTPAGLVKLRDQVAFDELSGVLRRVAGIAAAEREFARARRAHTPLSAVFVDMDGLKQVNDRKGHQAGDAFIRGVASRLRDSLRGQDLVFRYGGDEFVCILPGVGEEVVVEKFNQLRSQAVENGTPFSFGVAGLRPHEDLVSFLGRADEQLYEQRGKRQDAMAGGRMVPMPVHSRSGRSSRRSI